MKEILEREYPASDWISKNLSTPAQASADKVNFDRLQQAYRACRDNTPTTGLQQLREVMAFIAALYSGHEPAASGSTLAFLGRARIPHLFTVSPDTDNTTVVLIAGDPEYYHAGDNTADGYLELGAEVLSALHPGNISSKSALSLMKDISSLENRIKDEMLRTDTAAVMVLDQLDAMAPHLNLSYVIRSLVPATLKFDKVSVRKPNYFANTTRQLFADFSGDVVQSYFIWKTFQKLATSVVSDISKKYMDYQARVSYDPTGSDSILGDCVAFIDRGLWTGDGTPSILSWVLSRFYVGNAYPLQTREAVHELLKTLQQAYIANFRSKPWISDASKQAADQHLRAVKPDIGFPDSITNPLYLDTSELELTRTHAWNVLSLARADVVHRWVPSGPNTAGDGLFHEMSALTHDAVFNPRYNSMAMPAAMAHSPGYVPGVPGYLLYGFLGGILGHELTHGYDGNPLSMEGWDDASKTALRDRAACLVAQYDNYTVAAPNGTVVHVQGKQTQNENMADHGGVRTSFLAWRAAQAAHGRPEEALPGLEAFSNEQLFFLQWAQGWCGISTPEAAVKAVRSDTHAPRMVRIQGSLANSRDFREAFSCPVKEPTCDVF